MVISKYRRPLGLMLVVLWLSLAAVPAAASNGARVYDLRVTVPFTGLSTVPPDPCHESILLDGSAVLSAHIVIPPNVGDRPAMLVDLHVNGDGISGTGLTTGDLYRGGQGNTATFKFDTTRASFRFDSMVDLRVGNPDLIPPGPCGAPNTIDPCWFVTITMTESGPRLSAVLLRLLPPKTFVDR